MKPILAGVLALSLTACAEGEGRWAETGAASTVANPSAGTPQIDSLLLFLEPEAVKQGSLFRIVLEVTGDQPDSIGGNFGGEPLHFESASDGRFRALAAAPIDALGAVELTIEPTWGGSTDAPMVRTLSISAGEYRMERLTVAPEFGGGYSAELQRRIDEESARAMAVSRASHRTPRLWSPPIVHPREDRITSGFGHGRSFNGQVQSRHMGTDYAGAIGAPVLAPARGVVALVDTFYLGGNVLYLDHGAGLVTGYLHLSEHLVTQGDTVEAGESIARVGATGRVTGPHLHWIVRYGVITVDGQSLLDLP
jgi:murein DD-endopeptidase MepM/ murein hydrolase activator NlpD